VAARVCTVSFVDVRGIRHSVDVEADSLFEAAVLAVKRFRQERRETQSIATKSVSRAAKRGSQSDARPPSESSRFAACLNARRRADRSIE
jgi:hypothetical protein